MTQPMCLKLCLDSYLSAKVVSMSMRYLDQILEVQTYADGNFLDLILPQSSNKVIPSYMELEKEDFS